MKSKMKTSLLMALPLLLAVGACSSTDKTTDDTAKTDEETPVVEETVKIDGPETGDATAHYDVVYRDGAATVDGTVDEVVWEDVPEISGAFFYPWDDKEAPKTVFKAYNDGENLYFMFDATDPEVLVDEEWKDDESTVDNEDRAEIFLAQGVVDEKNADGTIPLYYGVEIDPDGRVHDYSIEYYRNFDGTWNLENLETAGSLTDGGYVVEGSVPLSTLKDLNLLKDDGTLRAGLYRAEFSSQEGKDEPLMEWISWVDPKTEEPDYHVDSSFGELRVLNKTE